MNLVRFLEIVDETAKSCSREQLETFIHGEARELSESSRDRFLHSLLEAASGLQVKKGQAKEDSSLEKRDDQLFRKRYQTVKAEMEKLLSGECFLEADINEEYDDWYAPDEPEFLYSDPHKIQKKVQDACFFVHDCLDREHYGEGLEIGQQLFALEIPCDSDYDCDDLSIEDLYRSKLLTYSPERLLLETLCCGYLSASMPERPAILYSVMLGADEREITLEKVIQFSPEELPDIPEFINRWIEYLGEKDGREADRMILDAISMIGDLETARSYAHRYSDVHPGLYARVLHSFQDTDPNTLASVGLEAMDVIPKSYQERSEIALDAASCLIRGHSGTPDQLDQCYYAAFESDMNGMNYLRALLCSQNSSSVRDSMHELILKYVPEKGRTISPVRRKFREWGMENRPDYKACYPVHFLDGNFRMVLSDGLTCFEPLGWSQTFMKDGIALFLLSAYRGKTLPQGLQGIMKFAREAFHFSEADYQKGLPSEPSIQQTFWTVFSKWREMTPMDETIQSEALVRIEELLKMRTAGIMEVNRRNYYGECAAFIAALGETEESVGQRGRKQELMTFYKNLYPRRSAFRAELKQFGWKG